MTSKNRLLTAGLAALLVSGCATMNGATHVKTGSVPVLQAQSEIAADQLMDVWIEIFDPGTLPSDKKKAAGLSMDIREAEARFMPVQLRRTMEATGYWAAVRVVPQDTEGAELLVSGSILASDGEYLALEIQAEDATGRTLLRRKYDYTAPETSAQSVLAMPVSPGERFQPLYSTIANDLARLRAGMDPADIRRVREIAEMRFAADLAPDTFASYLDGDLERGYTLNRLPAENDPMFNRIRAIRARDAMLVDVLSGHVENFHDQMSTPYDQWREARAAEAAAVREIKAQATKRKLLGLAAIIAGIGLQRAESRSRSGTNVGAVIVAGGVLAAKSGFDIARDADIHREAISELGESFASEARPLLVEVEGETHELTGSAEVQYEKWREILRRIYASETGLETATP